jgi:endoglucanase
MNETIFPNPRSVAVFAVLALACGRNALPPSVAPTPKPPATGIAPTPLAAPTPPSGLRRGINLGDALDAPSEGEWGVVLSASDFVDVRQAGFDHVRLPARFSGHALEKAPFTIEAAFLSRVDWAIDQALSNGLAVIVDLHHYQALMTDPEENRARFVGLWTQIAQHEHARPADVVFELCNEPTAPLTADQWNSIMGEALHAVRASNPTRTIVLEGVGWASAKSLRDTLAIPSGDANIVGSFHMYQPILFTHQGADFMPSEYETTGIIFPGPPSRPIEPSAYALKKEWVSTWFQHYNEEPAARNPSGPATIDNQLDVAHDFAERTHVPVYMGEFGVIDNADAASRTTWTRMTREGAERRGFGWAYWDDGGKFKVYDRASRKWNDAMLGALLR